MVEAEDPELLPDAFHTAVTVVTQPQFTASSSRKGM